MNAKLPMSLGIGAWLALGALAQTGANNPAPLKGTVVDASGAPAAGATVGLYSSPSSGFALEELELEAQVVTDATGAFEFGGQPRSSFVNVLARKPGLAPAWSTVTRLRSPPLRLVLTPPGTLAGTVVDETDKPVNGAEVSTAFVTMEVPNGNGGRDTALLAGPQARELFSSRTDAEGRFRIESFPTNASAMLLVRVPGKSLRPPAQPLNLDTLPYQPGQPDIRLVVEPAGTIEGRITVAESGAALPVARLTLRPQVEGLFALVGGAEGVLAKPDGTFRITDVPAGSHRVHATFGTNTPPDWVAVAASVTVDSGQTVRDLEIPAVRGGLLEVMVVSAESHKPLDGVMINTFREGDQSAARTATDGRARLRLTPGDYQILAQQPGVSMQQTQASVEGDKTNRVELELSGPRKLQGIVRRPDGQPAGGVLMRVVGGYSPDVAATKTDTDGKFLIEWSPQQFGGMERSFCLLARDPEQGLAAAQDVDEDTGPLELRLEPGLTIAGRAVFDGKPIPNATAALVFWTGNSGMHLPGLTTATNAPGQFEIPALPVGRRYGLYVSAPGYGQRFVNEVPSSEGKRVEVDPVELKPANLKLSGQVVDADDKPVAGANVYLHGEGQPNANARTDREGRFTFTQVCEGNARLAANANNLSGSVGAEGGDTNVVVRLGESYGGSTQALRRTVKGTVSDPDGQPVRSAELAVFPFNQQGRRKTDTNGAFNLTFTIEPWQMQSGGDPCLVVRDLARNLAATEDLPEEATNLTVQLRPALTLTGRVESVSGSPLSGAQVGMWLLAGNTYSQFNEQPVSADANGAFALKAVPPGRKYIIFASAKDHGRQQQPLQPEDEPATVAVDTFVLKFADQILAGQVVDEREKPVSGAHVSLSGDGQPEGSIMTDSQGRFRFKVCDGAIRLFVSGQDGYANASAEPGDTNLVVVLSRSGMSSGEQRPRASLVGRPLPDLGSVNVAGDSLPAGKPRLVCLFDAEQRPSRRVLRQLSEQHDTLTKQGIAVVAVQATVMADDAFREWKEANAVSFPVGRFPGKSAATKWVTDLPSLPWLMLTDTGGKVIAEGFPFDELDAKLAPLK